MLAVGEDGDERRVRDSRPAHLLLDSLREHLVARRSLPLQCCEVAAPGVVGGVGQGRLNAVDGYAGEREPVFFPEQWFRLPGEEDVLAFGHVADALPQKSRERFWQY